MVRYTCALILAAGLTGCAKEVRYVPQTVFVEKECPALADQVDATLFSPFRTLGRPEVVARGGLTRHLWLVFLEMEAELEYANARMRLIQREIDDSENR